MRTILKALLVTASLFTFGCSQGFESQLSKLPSTGGQGTQGLDLQRPTDLSALATSTNQISLSWIDTSDTELGFYIERASAGSAFVPIGMVSANVTVYVAGSLNASTAYTFRVRAYNADGPSDYTNESSATTLTPSPTPMPTPTPTPTPMPTPTPTPTPMPAPMPPAAPSTLTSMTVSATQINLTWRDNSSDETGFYIERASGGGAYTRIATRPAGTTAYSAQNLTASTSYSFRVSAYNANGDSAYSNVSTATTQAAPPPVSTMKTVFMASGHMGRTVMSCDGGRSWIRDRSDNDNTRCWVDGNPNYVECDHTPQSGRGIDSGDGWFFANFGWGFNGSLRRSRDGVTWQTLQNNSNGGGVAYYQQKLALFWNPMRYSTDNGATWSSITNPPNYLSHPLIYRAGDKFIAFGRTDGMAISRDQGQTWERHNEFLQSWGGQFAEGNGVLVGAGQGTAAYSTDGGRTWNTSRPHSNRWIGLIFDGTQFVGWTSSQVYRSTNGQTWTLAGNVSGVPNFNGPIQFNPETRTYTAIPNIWGQYYASQRAYFSTDGISWSVLNATAFRGSHPINHITVGPMDAANCP